MTSPNIFLKVFICATTAVLLASCGEPNSAHQSSLYSIQNSSSAREISAQHFRDIFFTLGKNSYAEHDLETLLFFPTPEMMIAPDIASPNRASINTLQNLFRDLKPSQAYEEGVQRGHNNVAAPLEVLRSNPPTVILFPGVFVEFSASRPFEEVLQNQKSAAAIRWQEILRANAQKPAAWDKSLNLKKRRDVAIPLNSVINVASIDDANGAPLVNVVYLRPPRGSLESTGTSEQHTERALRRLNAFFELWGNTDSNIFLMGYSRGGIALLDLLVESRKNTLSYPWSQRIRSAVGIGGTIQGSYFADQYFENPQGLGLNVSIFVNLARSLELPQAQLPQAERWALARRNIARWKAALNQISASTQNAPPADPGLTRENIQPQPVSTTYAFNVAKSILGSFRLPTIISNNEIENIESFKLAAEYIHNTFADVSSHKIQNWWRTHAVPTNVSYVSILSTMFDKTEAGKNPNPLVFNPLAYAPHSIDFAMNRGGYYSLANETGIAINDGAVTAPEATFSVAGAMTANPNQKPFRVLPLGVLGSHHWSSVMPYGVLTRNQQPSAFPRTLLMLSLAVFLQESVEN